MAHLRLWRCRGNRWPIADRRVLQQGRADRAHDEEDRAEDSECCAPSVGSNQRRRERAHDGRPGTVAADHETYDEAAAIGKPLRGNGRRHRVAKSVADSHDHTERQIEEHQRVRQAAQGESTAHENGPEECADLGATCILQPARPDEGERERDDGDRVDP